MHADIFIGVVYYQRLRHMVSDKSQVRATGQVNQLTRQPIKGKWLLCLRSCILLKAHTIYPAALRPQVASATVVSASARWSATRC